MYCSQGSEKSPFLLQNEHEYQFWRASKLQRCAERSVATIFQLNADQQFDADVLREVQEQVESFGFARFESSLSLEQTALIGLNRQLGLVRMECSASADRNPVTSLRVLDHTDSRARYIPFSNSALNWHTDGYYNETGNTIRAFSLYCVTPASSGGTNFLFDHEMMYLLIRDQNPELIAALMRPDIMTVPANVRGNEVLRAQVSCPVFSIGGCSQRLQMRYTSRPRHVIWREDCDSARALALIDEILMEPEAGVHLTLQAGQGIVCNNLLHGRTAFEDTRRLVYRVRSYDFIDTRSDLDNGAE